MKPAIPSILSLTFILSMTFILVACGGTTVQYQGDIHSPTNTVKVFHKRSEVPSNYRVMGRAIATSPGPSSGREVLDALLKEAKDEGADAILVGPYKRVETDAQRQWNFLTSSNPQPSGTDTSEGWGFADDHWGTGEGDTFDQSTWTSNNSLGASSIRVKATFFTKSD